MIFMNATPYLHRGLCFPGAKIEITPIVNGKCILAASLVQPGEPVLKGRPGLSIATAIENLEAAAKEDAEKTGQ